MTSSTSMDLDAALERLRIGLLRSAEISVHAAAESMRVVMAAQDTIASMDTLTIIEMASVATNAADLAERAAEAATAAGAPAMDVAASAQRALGSTERILLIAEAVRIGRMDVEHAIALTEAALADVAGAAADALRSLARTSTQPSTGESPRQPGRLSHRLVGLAVIMLLPEHRERFREEWLSLLTELPTRRARARHGISILAGAPRQSQALRRPRTDEA